MLDAAMMVVVIGVVALALVVDVTAVIGFLRRRIAERAERLGP
jgi:hypothetical protein